MPRAGRGKIPEKSKDFKGSMKRLLQNLKEWHVQMVFALTLAMISAILALIAPNKLSDLTDIISEGIRPNTEVLKEISNRLEMSLSQENIQKKIPEILSSPEITEEDKKMFQESMKASSPKEMMIPKSILLELLTEYEINGKKVSKEDQYELLMLSQEEANEEDMLLMISKLPENIYEVIKPLMDMKRIKNIALLLTIFYLISALFSYIQHYSMTTVSNNFAKKLRGNISKKINTLPLKYFDTHETGDVLSRVTNDVDNIAQNLNNSLATLVTSLTLFIGSIFMMFVTNWMMAITAIVTSLIGFSFIGIILGKSQKYFTQRQIELGNMNGYIEEIYSGHNVVKAYNGDQEAIQNFKKLNENLFDCNRKSAFLSGLMPPIMGFVGNLGYVAVCVVGAVLTMNDIISFGVIVAFMIYVRLFTNPLSQIAQAMTNLQTTAASSERVFEFLDEEEMKKQNDCIEYVKKENVKGNIEFEHVQFGYDPSRTIIQDFSVKASPGQKIAIVGPTGAGKTTMVNLLMKFYDIHKGDIKIDGISTKKLTRENIHELFIMVLQDTWLFEGTIRENIVFNKKNVTDKDIWHALKVVGVEHFVSTLPGGLDYVLSENDSISSGQKQLLTIARGMIEDAPFLILDEATSNVDTRTEELVQKAMDKLTEGRTSFIIAHRLSTIKNADLILVMKDGNIIEQGNHEELMKQKGFYESLYNSQFEL